MVHNEATYSLFFVGRLGVTLEEAKPVFEAEHAMPIPWVESEDISNAVVFLTSDEARYITGVALAIDGRMLIR